MNVRTFDFLDFGASKGASIEFAKNHLFGKRGLGIDLDPERVDKMRDAGYDSMVGDITNLELPAKCVRFVKMAHILEHLPDLKSVEKTINSAKKSATDFIVITGPFFDEDKYLRSKGFKLYWSDYPEHTYHLKVKQLIKILEKLKLNDYELYLRYPIMDSSDEHVQPLSSPPGTHHYSPKLHPRKKKTTFDRSIWVDFVCYIRLKKVNKWDEITKAYNDQVPYIEKHAKSQYVWSESSMKKYAETLSAASTLRAEQKKLNDKITNLEQQLKLIRNSKSWKLARVIRMPVIALKNPAGVVKKVKHKFRL